MIKRKTLLKNPSDLSLDEIQAIFLYMILCKREETKEIPVL